MMQIRIMRSAGVMTRSNGEAGLSCQDAEVPQARISARASNARELSKSFRFSEFSAIPRARLGYTET
jgi:hypothetical protein